jgi:hypothetical protein
MMPLYRLTSGAIKGPSPQQTLQNARGEAYRARDEFIKEKTKDFDEAKLTLVNDAITGNVSAEAAGRALRANNLRGVIDNFNKLQASIRTFDPANVGKAYQHEYLLEKANDPDFKNSQKLYARLLAYTAASSIKSGAFGDAKRSEKVVNGLTKKYLIKSAAAKSTRKKQFTPAEREKIGQYYRTLLKDYQRELEAALK